MTIDRRTLLKGGALGLALAGAGGIGAGGAARGDVLGTVRRLAGIPSRSPRTPVKNIVVVMMENRSVDHLLGWYGGENRDFDGRQRAQFPDLRAPGAPLLATESWGQRGRNSYHGRGFEDPSHGWDGGRAERNGGRVDGWLHPDTGNDEFTLSYYDALDVPVWAQLTRDYQSYDRWHCSVLGPTQPNRYYLHSGTSGGFKNNTLPPEIASEHPEWTLGWDWPTLWTLFDTYDITSSYFYSNLPELAFWGHRHVNQMHHISEYYARAAAGTLPQVSFVDPFFTVGDDFGNDDHPHADLRLGQAFLSDVTEAFVTSRHYREGALVITYDEWGGFWDHVDPPQLADDRATPSQPGGPDDYGQTGFRVPSTIVSPWTRSRGSRVDHTVYEHTSIGRFICENWGLPLLTTRMRGSHSIEGAFGGFRSFDPEPKLVPYQAPPHVTVESAASALVNFVSDPSLPFAPPPPPDPEVEGGLGGLRDIGWMEKFGIRTDYQLEDSFMRSRPELLTDVRAGGPRVRP